VPVPANPQALSLSQAQKLGLDLSLLATKGIKFEEKAEVPQAGDPCKLDDGSEGILEDDGNGDLVCVPKPSEKKEDPENPEEEKTFVIKNKDHIQQAINALKATIADLETLLQAVPSQAGEGEDNSDGNSPKQRSNSAGSGAPFNFKDWKFSREVLRAIVTSGSEALERFNKSAKAQAGRK
jgi:hypothetical protein